MNHTSLKVFHYQGADQRPRQLSRTFHRWLLASKPVTPIFFTNFQAKTDQNNLKVEMKHLLDREGGVENVLCTTCCSTPKSDLFFKIKPFFNIRHSDVSAKSWGKEEQVVFWNFTKELGHEYPYYY